jgi:glyoxylase-like metal-dependent hydrolase (beta-lactamase superfamily II)
LSHVEQNGIIERMWFESLIRKETGCVAYAIGADAGVSAVFDPLWDIGPYLALARRKSSTIRYVIDSHSHADHVSGARRLAAATGAELILPELAEITYEARRVEGGDELELGEVTLRVIHTPGHRPEQINLAVIDHSRGDEPWMLLTADFLLVGDVARPDLAQGGEDGARTIFDVALPAIADLPDFVEVYPGHVAGST